MTIRTLADIPLKFVVAALALAALVDVSVALYVVYKMQACSCQLPFSSKVGV